MNKSIVGDPVYWQGLIYAPLNNAGLLFALGSVAAATGLLFEEFDENCSTAICRRKSENGWERLRVEIAYRSSSRQSNSDDLIGCQIYPPEEAG